jgi:hypothetical protein
MNESNKSSGEIVKSTNQKPSQSSSNIAKRALGFAKQLNNLKDLSTLNNSSSLIENDVKPSSIVDDSKNSGLVLEINSRYQNLKKLLAEAQWLKADNETIEILLQLGEGKKKKWLGIKDIDKIPCEDLHIIDQLWVKYSNGRFGFSIQKELLERFWDGSQTIDYHYSWCKFGELVGWRVNQVWTNATEAEDVMPAWLLDESSPDEKVKSTLQEAEKLPLGYYPRGCRLRVGGIVWWAGAPRFPWGPIYCALMLRLKQCSSLHKQQ